MSRRKRQVIRALVQRQQLADALVRYLGTLGLERRVRNVDIAAELAAVTHEPRKVNVGRWGPQSCPGTSPYEVTAERIRPSTSSGRGYLGCRPTM